MDHEGKDGMSQVRLVGLDFGTTTSRAIVAAARLAQNAVTGRQELTDLHELFRSEPVFTPFTDEGLDIDRLRESLDQWLAAGQEAGEEIFGGGALVTGLAAQAQNVAVLVDLIRSRCGDAFVALAGDPCLEAWVAFHASAAAISRAHPERCVVNLDIGGGTTNMALGKNGEVVRTGSLFIGARHVQVVPGTYRITKLSHCAQRLFEHLDITRKPGDSLKEAEVAAILDFYLDLLESALVGRKEVFHDPIRRLHQQAPFESPVNLADAIVTVSGGVGELVYAQLSGAPLPSTTSFGDLGIDLARRILASSTLAPTLGTFVPASAGRATVYGLLRHATQISGSTLFLPDPTLLPLRQVPIFGRLTGHSTEDEIRDTLHAVRRSPSGGCIAVSIENVSAAAVAAFGSRMARALKAVGFPANRPLVLLVQENVGKALGHYVTEWGNLPLQIVVVDEIVIREARFVQIGARHNQIVPISFYGMI
jgi:ethanolamine utilization protein EutA